MKVRIQLDGPGGELNAIVLEVDDETDDRISGAVIDIAKETLAVGDTITITEIEEF